MDRAELNSDAFPDMGGASRTRASRLHEALELAGLGIWELDHTTQKLTWSEEMFRLFELPASADPTIDDFLGRVHDADREEVTSTFDHAVHSGQPFALEHRLCMPDGRVKWVLARGRTRYGDGARPERSIGTVQEISARILRARAFGDALSALAMSPALAAGDVDAFARELTEAATAATGVERANVWLFDADEESLSCVDCYEASKGEHSTGMRLTEAQFGNEFRALKSAPYVDADDAMNDPRTAGYIDSYIKPLRITSMLDTVIRESGRNLGLVCLEHVDLPHHWQQDEIDFACRLGDKVGVAISNRRTRQAHTMLQERVKELRCVARVTELLQDTEAPWHEVLQAVVEVLPSAWQYEDAACARILAGKQVLMSPGWRDTPWQLDRDIVVDGQVAGRLEVGYRREYPEHDDGPFLHEECALIDLVALKIGEAWSRRRAEAAVRRLSRIRAMTSAINTLLLREHDRDALFADTCRIAVERGGFLMASVAVADTSGALHPAVSHGRNAAEAATALCAPHASDPPGTGPAARCLREQHPLVVNDTSNDKSAMYLRDTAQQYGYRSVACLPLRCHRQTVACLQLFAGEVDYFDDEEMELLTEMAADVSFALDVITQRDQIDFLALHDPLTRLANRGLFTDRLGGLLQTAGHHDERVAVLVLDMARFKSINEALGFTAADEVLRVIAQRLSTFAGGTEHVARIGGDRFAAALPRVGSASRLASLVREKLAMLLGRKLTVAGVSLHPSARIGIAMFPEDGADADTLFQNAEAALKQAKSSGESCLFFTQQMNQAVRDRLSIEGELFRAMERDELTLHYQPKVDLRSGRICGAEALLRWEAGQVRGVSGETLIAVLADMGRMADIGSWALRRVLDEGAQWARAGLSVPPVSVNITPSQLLNRDFVDEITALLKGQPQGAPQLELEVTESGLIADIEAALATLRELHALGVPVTIDDFGTGYSSLSYLARLPVGALKIDRSFIEQMIDNGNAMKIVTTVISLAHSLGLCVIAEGVETAEQLRFLRLLRCDQIQGFLFSPAVPPDAFAQLLREPPGLPATD